MDNVHSRTLFTGGAFRQQIPVTLNVEVELLCLFNWIVYVLISNLALGLFRICLVGALCELVRVWLYF